MVKKILTYLAQGGGRSGEILISREGEGESPGVPYFLAP